MLAPIFSQVQYRYSAITCHVCPRFHYCRRFVVAEQTSICQSFNSLVVHRVRGGLARLVPVVSGQRVRLGAASRMYLQMCSLIGLTSRENRRASRLRISCGRAKYDSGRQPFALFTVTWTWMWWCWRRRFPLPLIAAEG